MADSRFFTRCGPFSLAQIAALTGAVLAEEVDGESVVVDVAPLDVAGKEHLSFLDNPKYVSHFKISNAAACLVHPKHVADAPKGMALLLTEEPYRAYAEAAQAFYPMPESRGTVAPTALVSPSATLAENVEIGHAAYIGKQAEIGKDSIIAPGAYIGDGVRIGDRTRIGANATLTHCLVGHDVIIHAGAHIGQDGFGFARGPKGAVKVPQLGRVIIEDWVEIGAGTCIDRGAGPDTVIMLGAKIDNLVQIAHNVRIGRFATIVAQVGISGSTLVGDGAVLAGQVGVAGHLNIGKGAVLAARSGVTKDIPDGVSYGGFPAMPIHDWRRQMASIARLGKKKNEEGTNDDGQ